jgi:hypothetical protein
MNLIINSITYTPITFNADGSVTIDTLNISSITTPGSIIAGDVISTSYAVAAGPAGIVARNTDPSGYANV